MAGPTNPKQKITRSLDERVADALRARGPFFQRSETHLSREPVQTEPTVTLRRTAPTDGRSFAQQAAQLTRFWNGATDTITLSGVEVVPTRATEPQSGATNNTVDTANRHDQDNMLGRGMMDFETQDGGNSVTATQGTPQFPPSSVWNDITTWTPPYDDVFADFEFLNDGFPDVNFPAIPEIDRAATLDPRQALPARLPTPPRMPHIPFFGVRGTGQNRDPYRFASGQPFLPRPDSPTSCRACMEDLESPIFLSCGHGYCQPCLNHLVRSGLANKMSFPPRCCTGRRGIDMASIQAHLDQDVLTRYLDVVEEFSTPNPVYCANPVCSRYIEQSRVRDTPGKFVQCGQCQTPTCTECKQGHREHTGRDAMTCKKVEELMNPGDRKLAQNNQWKQCPGCKNLVEKTEGCNHMICECGTDFCYRCGTKQDGYAQCDCYGGGYEFPMPTSNALDATQLQPGPIRPGALYDAIRTTQALRQSNTRRAEAAEPAGTGRGHLSHLSHLRQAATAAGQLMKSLRRDHATVQQAVGTNGQQARDDLVEAERRRAASSRDRRNDLLLRDGPIFHTDPIRNDPIMRRSTEPVPNTRYHYRTDITYEPAAEPTQHGSLRPLQNGSASTIYESYIGAMRTMRGQMADWDALFQTPRSQGEESRGLKREIAMTEPLDMGSGPALRMRLPPQTEDRPEPNAMVSPNLSPVREAVSPDRAQPYSHFTLPYSNTPPAPTGRQARAMIDENNPPAWLVSKRADVRQAEEREAWLEENGIFPGDDLGFYLDGRISPRLTRSGRGNQDNPVTGSLRAINNAPRGQGSKPMKGNERP
ncbi:hypothetical protein A1O1_05378 [Capronia coronata CBS 617.96]|uniref:RBR-type E3 ubiquitin transferase n=1 Tax=Capronia coronata CBS 617.96 TaxID=1182541 RepID=W9Y7G0_9EURO|nr:uncharacterized protein A1O1_05378 [Capronia coronata CBS 617.96]EXJ88448.1 hypothetical protein A1O1_05378 [Capronia coronata CBS 617.96]